MKNMILVLLIFGAAAFGVLNFHFILFDDSLKIIKKIDFQYENTFVNARGSNKYKMALEPDLIAAGINDFIN